MFRAGWIAVLGGGAGFVSNDREWGLEEGGGVSNGIMRGNKDFYTQTSK